MLEDISEQEDEMREEAPEQEDSLDQKRQALLDSLAMTVHSKLKDRAANRRVKELQWIEADQLRLGSASFGQTWEQKSDEPFGKSSTGNRAPEINVVREKLKIALAQLISKQFSGGDKNWDCNPLPVDQQQAPPQVVNQAVERMEETIYKQMTASKYGIEARKAMEDYVFRGTGILKAPQNQLRHKKTYQVDPASGVAIPIIEQIKQPSVTHVPIWFAFPDDTVDDFSKCEDFIEVHPTSKQDMVKLLGRPDFFKDQVHEVLEQEPKGFIAEAEVSTYGNFSNNQKLWDNKYCLIEYHGPLCKEDLEAMGVEIGYESPQDMFYAEVWVCQGFVVRLELSNIEGAQGVPYYGAQWEKDPGNIFGIPAAISIKDSQFVVNTAWRAVLDNASIAAGPQLVVDSTIVQPQNGKWDIEPFKIWRLTQFGSDVRQAVQYINPPVNIGEMMNVLNSAMSFAEMESGVPLLTQGMQSPNARDAGATGIAVMEEHSTTLLDMKAEEWDDCVTHPVVQSFYEWNMQYNPDPSIKVNLEIDVRTSTDIKGNQVAAKNIEKMMAMAAQNPEAAMVLKQDEAYRTLLSLCNLPHRGIVRTPDEVAQIQQQQQQNQQPNPDVLQVQLDMQKLELEKQKFEFDAQYKIQLAQLDSEDKRRNAEIRAQEAQAQVIAKQFEYQAAMAQVAARSEVDRARIIADLEKADTDRQADLFLAGQESSRKNRELVLKEAEAIKAIKTNKGW